MARPQGLLPPLTWVISGERVSLSQEDVIRRLRGVTPGTVHEHAVEVGGVLYPVKEAFSLLSGIDVLDFNTNQARAVFKKLGLKVVRQSAGSRERGSSRLGSR